MQFKLTTSKARFAKRCHGFTLAEVLAAMVFMAIVIPTAVHGLRVANQAGQIGLRRATAARVGDQMLNELLVTHQWQTGAQRGVVQEGPVPYQWMIRTQPWTELPYLQVLTIVVTFPVQGQDYEVHLSTLIDPSLP